MLKGVTKCRNVVVWGRDAKKMALYKKDVEKMGQDDYTRKVELREFRA